MRSTPLLIGLGALVIAASGPVQAHDVKDPVCRMTVDSDTTRYRHRLGNKSFYFCSRQCQDRFATSPEKYEKLAAQLEKQDLHAYEATVTTTEPARAGQPVTMEFTLRYRESKLPVKELEKIHERLLHLIMVTEDLSWFEHQHPEKVGEGRFRKTWTFPRPGRYRLYLDFTPADGDNQVLQLPLVVEGGPAEPRPLRPDAVREKRIGEYQIQVALRPGSLRMEQAALLTYTVRDRHGRPIRDLQPFIGASGHLLAIRKDGSQVIHTHAIQPTNAPEPGHQEPPGLRVTPEMATDSGPNLTFKLTVPEAGMYRTWAQFLHRNRVLTVPFTFRVAGLWEESAPDEPGKAAGTTTVRVNGGYAPASLSVRAGRPVALKFLRSKTDGCGETLLIPALGIKAQLRPGEEHTIRFTPRRKGRLEFTCGMKMYRGVVVVR